VIAHIDGVPGEELIPRAVGAGTALLVARTWVSLRLPRRRGRGGEEGDAETPVTVGLR
jgi:hypothetical protein